MSGVKMRHIGVFLPLVVLGMIFATSCERDEMVETVKLSSNKIIYDAGWADGSAYTKSAQVADDAPEKSSSQGMEEFLMTFEGDSLFMYISEVDNRTFISNTEEQDWSTKAAPITAVSSFNVSAFTSTGNLFIAKDAISVDNYGKGSSDRYWPESAALNFFAWASSVTPSFATANEVVTSSLELDATQIKGSFSYNLPAPGTDATTAVDAVNQPDLIFAISADQTKESNSGTVEMQFHHALAAIYFKVGNMPKGLTIKSISIKGVHSAGECTFVPNSSNPNKPLNIDFIWSDQTATASFTQNFNLSIADDRTGMGTLDQVNSSAMKEAVFMMIPQDISGDAELGITFKVGENEYTLSKKFSEITSGSEWKADKKYVYVISTPTEVDVEIEDQVEGNVKSNLQITNTGLATSYIRTAIVGYWIVDEGENSYIVQDWKETDGEYIWGSGWDSYWKKGSDGYYYYKYPIEAGEQPALPLFEKYELIVEPPVVDAQLQMSVLVQAVIATAKTDSWPWAGDVLTFLSDTPE